jgi:hypothetical protein
VTVGLHDANENSRLPVLTRSSSVFLYLTGLEVSDLTGSRRACQEVELRRERPREDISPLQISTKMQQPYHVPSHPSAQFPLHVLRRKFV